MRETAVKNAIIFCNRKKDVGTLYRSLQRHGFNVGALHGDMDQHQRTATLDAFRSGQIAFLAASDVAARGLDIPDVSHIFNYDVPIHPEDYVHRIGRTGRAGREGFAAMLVTPKDYKALKAIEKMLGYEIAWVDGPPSEEEQREAEASGHTATGAIAAAIAQDRTSAPTARAGSQATRRNIPRSRTPITAGTATSAATNIRSTSIPASGKRTATPPPPRSRTSRNPSHSSSRTAPASRAWATTCRPS